jgi:cytochrome b561
MTTANTRTRYGTVAMSLHWLIAALVITNLYLGLSFESYTRGDPALMQVVMIHKSIGLTVLILSIARLIWRLMNPVPPLPAGMNPILKFLARATHWLLYFLIIVIPLSGWLMVSVGPRPIPFFGLFDWPKFGFLAAIPAAQQHATHESFESIHVTLAWSAIVLIVIHICGALYHQFLSRDDVFKRMLPGTNVADEA